LVKAQRGRFNPGITIPKDLVGPIREFRLGTIFGGLFNFNFKLGVGIRGKGLKKGCIIFQPRPSRGKGAF